MSIKITVHVAARPVSGISFELDRATDEYSIIGAITREGDSLYGATWPDALYEIEEYISGLRMSEPAYRHTLTQAYDEDTQSYIPATNTSYTFQLVTERSDHYPLIRSHVFELREVAE